MMSLISAVVYYQRNRPLADEVYGFKRNFYYHIFTTSSASMSFFTPEETIALNVLTPTASCLKTHFA